MLVHFICPQRQKGNKQAEQDGFKHTGAHEHTQKQVGKTLPCIVDSHSGQRDDVWIGRTQADAPDIDCVVYITAPDTNPLTPLAGKIVPVQMVAAAGYDLAGVATDLS